MAAASPMQHHPEHQYAWDSCAKYIPRVHEKHNGKDLELALMETGCRTELVPGRTPSGRFTVALQRGGVSPDS